MTAPPSHIALWDEADPAAWLGVLARYDEVLEAQGLPQLIEYDRWYHHALPAVLADRDPAYLTLDELVLVAKWKMTRGEWRARNLILIRSNEPESIEWHTREALLRSGEPRQPIATLSKLAGIGPATASAVLAAYAPDTYPFFDDLVAEAIPGLGPVKWTPRYYETYAERLRDRTALLRSAASHQNSPPGGWTPHMADLALWAASGGKAARAPG